ncbi:MAG: hypothetical protein ACWGQW_20350 [bacterium]
MSHIDTALTGALATSQRLAEADPQGEAVSQLVKNLQDQVSLLNELARADSGWGERSMKDDAEFIGNQIQKLKAAALAPAQNYARIVRICDGLRQAAIAARRPENAKIRPQLNRIVRKTAGVFAQVDTVDDLNKDLDAIEKAVHALYGDQSKNDTFYFDRRNKGHHGEG